MLKHVYHSGAECYTADWNLGEKSGLWQTQRVLEKLQFIYRVDAFFTINVVADEFSDNTNMIQVRVSKCIRKPAGMQFEYRNHCFAFIAWHMPWRGVRPSVRLSVWMSVTFVHCKETAKDILKLFSPPGNLIVLVFSETLLLCNLK